MKRKLDLTDHESLVIQSHFQIIFKELLKSVFPIQFTVNVHENFKSDFINCFNSTSKLNCSSFERIRIFQYILL